MELRQATPADMSALMEIFKGAQHFLQQQGVDQWQNGYPEEELICQDIQNRNSYVLTQNNTIMGTIAIFYGPEADYANIQDGHWHSDAPYAAIHRIAMHKSARGGGAATQMLEQAMQLIQKNGYAYVRVDTHRHNQPMQKFLAKQGFVSCGVIYLQDGAERIAFDKILG